MIKKTFYNLPKEKRQRIVDAIMKEFSSSSTDKVSINRIIKAANISRGSFYQYFDDKVDLVDVLSKKFIDVTLEGARKALRNSNGDIFFMHKQMFEIISDFAQDEKQKSILKNLFNNLRANDDLVTEYMANRFHGFAELQKIASYFNRDNLKYKDDYDVECLSQILAQVLKNSVFDIFVMGEDINKVRESFLRKHDIIKSGAVSTMMR